MRRILTKPEGNDVVYLEDIDIDGRLVLAKRNGEIIGVVQMNHLGEYFISVNTVGVNYAVKTYRHYKTVKELIKYEAVRGVKLFLV